VQILTNTHKVIDEYAKYIGKRVLFRYAIRYLSCVIYIRLLCVYFMTACGQHVQSRKQKPK